MHGRLSQDLKSIANLQLSFFDQVLKLRESSSTPVIVAELAEVPWPRFWWSKVRAFMQRLANMSKISLHRDILKDDIANALQSPAFGNWTAGVSKQ